MKEQRIIKKDLVYIIGLTKQLAKEEKLIQKEYFGQYGKIRKVVVNKDKPFQSNFSNSLSFSAYITFQNQYEAALAILSVDGHTFDNQLLKASFGMTKYCSFFINNSPCINQDCLYLHKIAEDDDCFSKDDTASQKKILKVDQDQIIEFLLNNKIPYELALKDLLKNRYDGDIEFPNVTEAVKKIKQYEERNGINQTELIIKKKIVNQKKIKQVKNKKVKIVPCQWGEENNQDELLNDQDENINVKKENLKSLLKDQQQPHLDSDQISLNDELNEDFQKDFPQLQKAQSEYILDTMEEEHGDESEEDIQKRSKSQEPSSHDETIKRILHEQEKILTPMDKSVLKNLQTSMKNLQRQNSRYEFVQTSEDVQEIDNQHIIDVIHTFLQPVKEVLNKKKIHRTHIKHINGYSLFDQCYTIQMNKKL